ncbi:hypothetical protein GRJ2_000781200 [Grus japonensis]|uniref:Uncharacterized protein n=1 Tax=Grus japonensis TaxID=30415 RepID=A0ABC9WED4_GRUJA
MLGGKRSWSSEASGCPPWGGTPQKRFLQVQATKAPPRRRRCNQRRWRQRRNTSPPGTSAIGLPSGIKGTLRVVVGPPGNGAEPRRVYLPEDGRRPRHVSPLKRNVAPRAVNPPKHGVWPVAANPPDNSVEPMEVDPPQDQEEPMEVDPPAAAMTRP